MKKTLLLAVLAMGCGGAVGDVAEPDAGDAAIYRCELLTSGGESFACDYRGDGGEAVTCDCPTSCSYYDVFSIKPGTCVQQ